MEQIFMTVLNMSLTAGWMILAVALLRLLLKRAPKTVRIALWGLVALRLAFPFRIESVLSLIPSAEPVPQEIAASASPAIASGIPAVDQSVNPALAAAFTPNPAASVNPLQIVTAVAARIWLAGAVLLLVYCLVSYLRLYDRVRTAVPLRGRIFECDAVSSPFVLGIFRPRIYLPFDMAEKDRELVIAHEETHIRRKDHWIKPFGFLLLAVHWFNPAVWLAYILLCRDIELACDERVIQTLGETEKRNYSNALLSCSVPHARIAACPVAFGEGNVKGRIKSVLNYKRPAFWVLIAAGIACTVLTVCFLTNPKEESGVVLIKENDFSSGGSAEAAVSAYLDAEAVIFDHQFAEPTDGLDPTKTFCFAGYSTESTYGLAVFQRNGEGSFELLKTEDHTEMAVQNENSAVGYYNDYWIFVCMDDAVKEIRFSGDLSDTLPVDHCPSIAVLSFFSRIPEGGGAEFAFYDAEGNPVGTGGSYGTLEEEILPCRAVADYPAVYDMLVDETVLGTETEAEQFRGFLSNLNGDKVSLMACSSGPWDLTENHREISAADSVLLLRYLRSLTDLAVYDQWENPATGGGWFIYLETADSTWGIAYNGEWLTATVSGPEGNKTYVFDASGATEACNNIGGIIGAYLGAPEELSDEELAQVQAAVNDILAQYRAGTVDTSVPENSEYRFEPLPEGCLLPEYVTVGLMTVYNNEILGGYNVQISAQNGLYLINLWVDAFADTDTGEIRYSASAVSFQSLEPVPESYLEYRDDGKTESIYFANLSLIPEFSAYNEGTASWDSDTETLSCVLTVSTLGNVGTVSGPQIAFEVDFDSGAGSEDLISRSYTPAEPVGEEYVARQYNGLFETASDERVIDMARLLRYLIENEGVVPAALTDSASVQNAAEVVRQHLLAEDSLSMEVESCEADVAETLRIVAMDKGSDLAKSRGWSDEMLENRFIVIRAVYDAAYDHTETFLNDGRQEAYFYLADLENTGVYTIVDSTTPNMLSE